MPRSILIGNGHFGLTLDKIAQIRDIYFPYLGFENHAVGHPFRLGVSVNGKFEWIGEDWKTSMTYMPETLTTRYKIEKQSLGVELEINDAIHHASNIFLRKVKIKNKTDEKQEVLIFFTHDFHISGYESGDTAIFNPQQNAIVHYKGKRYFLVGGASSGQSFYQYAVGYKETEDREGTWRDCEDGELSKNAVAQGAVDSAVSFKVDIPPLGYGVVHYWIAAGKRMSEVAALNSLVLNVGIEQLLLETENYWSAWVSRLNLDLNILPREVARLYKRSLLLMRAHIDSHGGFLASLDSDTIGVNRDTYSYVWPRDGAVAALAFASAGFSDVSASFFRFCNKVISDEGFFNHKYLPDGSIGSTWHALIDSAGKNQLPIQEDETASVLYALWKYYEKSGNIEFVLKVYDKLVVKASDFLVSYRDPESHLPKPSFDEWEEKVGVFTSTVASVCAALEAASNFAKVFYDGTRRDMLLQASIETKEAMVKNLYDPTLGRFIKGILPKGEKDVTFDSSVSTVFAYEVLDARDAKIENTMESLASNLSVNTNVGGLARYKNDQFKRVSIQTPGNPWFIATLRLARWHIAKATNLAELIPALDFFEWTAKNALDSGVLAEQLNPYTGGPISATPLLWSHSEFVLAVTEYINRHFELTYREEDKSAHLCL